MSFPFNSKKGLILVTAEVEGPVGTLITRLALDTGASTTLLSTAVLVTLGYDPAASIERHQVTTGSGVEFVPQVRITRFKALGQERLHFPILAHTLPPSAKVDGVVGLDFLRGLALTIDFRAGKLELI